MDATRNHRLARLLLLALVSHLTTATVLRAKETSTLVFTDPRVDEVAREVAAPELAPTAKKRSANGSLEIVPERKPQSISQPNRLQAAAAKPLPRPVTPVSVERPQQKTVVAESTVPLAAQPFPRPAERPLARPVSKSLARTSAPKPQTIQPVSHVEPVTAPDEVETSDPAAELLVEAHELSQQATAPEDYDEIIALCQSAKRLGAEGEQQEFADTLLAWAFNRRGQSRAEQGEQQLADEDFEQALQIDGNNWRALHNRGVSYAQAGNSAEALDDFNAVIKINPLFAKAFANRATLFAQSGDLEVALADYQRASRLDPKLFVAQVGRARTCHMLGQWEEALDAFNLALQLEPESPDVLCSRADLLSDMGRYGDALADYAHTIDLEPEFAHAYRNGAWLLATCPDTRYRDGANAIRGAERALEFGYGERHVALDTLAAAQASSGQFDEAIHTLEEALKIAPHDARTAYRARLRMYLAGKPFLTEPPAHVAQVAYEATDQ